MKKAITCTLMFVLLFLGVSRADEGERSLCVSYEGPFQLDPQSVNPALVLRQRLVTLRVALLSGGPGTKVILNLFDDVVLTAICDQVEQNTSGGFAWVGHIDGEEPGEVTLVVVDQTMAGSVSLPGRKYHVRPVNEHIHVAREIRSPLVRLQLSLPEAIVVSAEREVADLVNLERGIENLHPLTWNDELFAAARGHSLDMAQLNYFSHDSLDGREFFERIIAAGYDYNTCGENIATGYSTPQAVMNGWMNSPGHRANILNDSFCDIGVGYAYGSGSAYGHYWTQDFARHRGVAICAAAQFTITATSGPHGSISPSGFVTVQSGGTQTFRITPATGYRILDVKVDDLSVGAVAEYTFESVTANRTIEAYFYTLARKPMPWVLLLLDD